MRERILHLVVSIAVFAVVIAVPFAQAYPSGQQRPEVDAKVEIVFPHDAQGNLRPVSDAPLVNVEVFLFQRETLTPVPCDFPNEVTLRWARNSVQDFSFGTFATQTSAHDLPGLPSTAKGVRIVQRVSGRAFPAWVFNDVPIVYPNIPNPIVPNAPANLGLSKTFFFVDVDNADTRTSVWSHGALPGQTFFPAQVNPTSVATIAPNTVDAVIQVVFPHDAAGTPQPVFAAPLANIAVDLFQHPLGPAVPLNFNRRLRLLRSLNDGFLQEVDTAQVVSRQVDSLIFPRWVLNDVDVSGSMNPVNKYFFAVQVDGTETHTTIWAHGSEARTILPQVDVPATSGANCPST